MALNYAMFCMSMELMVLVVVVQCDIYDGNKVYARS